MHTNRRARHQEGGFSAIELIICLGIAGLMLGTVYRGVAEVLPRLRARQAVVDLSGALRATRAQAILERTTLTMPLDVDSARYIVVSRLAPGNIVQESTLAGIRRVARLPEGLRFGKPSSVSGPAVTLTDLGGTDPAVVFDPKGQVRATTLPGYIHLAADRDRRYWRIVVERAGNVRIQKWTGSAFE